MSKESPLKQFPPQVWDEFINQKADHYAPKNFNRHSIGCLVCKGFSMVSVGMCGSCYKDSGRPKDEYTRSGWCLDVPEEERVDNLIDRLYRAGVFEEC
jgi:hypothetical protein